MTPPMRILIVDDHAVTREGLRNALLEQSDMLVVGEAVNWADAMKFALELRPDVMILDLNLPDGNGWTLMEQLRAKNKLPRTIVLSICDEQIYARRLLKAGALGYLMKDEPLAVIVQAVRDVFKGHLAVSRTLASQLLREALGSAPEEPVAKNSPDSALRGLSDRELQIFSLLGNGERSKEIANRLNISDKSVATYKVRLMAKLGVNTTPALIARYKQWTLEGRPISPSNRDPAAL